MKVRIYTKSAVKLYDREQRVLLELLHYLGGSFCFKDYGESYLNEIGYISGFTWDDMIGLRAITIKPLNMMIEDEGKPYENVLIKGEYEHEQLRSDLLFPGEISKLIKAVALARTDVNAWQY